MEPDTIESEFGIKVKRQLNAQVSGGIGYGGDGDYHGGVRMSDEEYYKRYGYPRGTTNFLKERR